MKHIYAGDCPDETQPYSRDPYCRACGEITGVAMFLRAARDLCFDKADHRKIDRVLAKALNALNELGEDEPLPGDSHEADLYRQGNL